MRSRLPRPRSALWRHGDFVKLWSAQTISLFGSQVTLLALPLAAILVLDASTFEVGLLGAIEFAPFLLFGLPAGVWVDRWPRKPVLVLGDVARGVSLLSIPLAYAFDALSIYHLFAVGFLNGLVTVFFDVAYLAYLPALVRRTELVDANSKLEVSRSAAQLGGPALGGALVGLLSAPVAIVADAISFLCSALLVARLRNPGASDAAREARAPMRRELSEGLHYVFRQPYLGRLIVSTAASNFFYFPAVAISVLFMVRELGLSAERVGVVLALGHIGLLAGALVAGRVGRRVGVGRAIVGTALLSGFPWAIFALTPVARPEPFLVGAMFLSALLATVFNVNQLTLRQAVTPARLQGRMNSVVRFMYWGTIAIGMFLGGVLGTWIGLRNTLWLAAVGPVLTFSPLLFSPLRHLKEMPSEPDAMPAAPGTAAPPDFAYEPEP